MGPQRLYFGRSQLFLVHGLQLNVRSRAYNEENVGGYIVPICTALNFFKSLIAFPKSDLDRHIQNI
jgi:hypothetical protein